MTSSDNYQPGGAYELFCGYDISIACAHYSTDEKWLGVPFDPETTKLNFSQEQNLQAFYIGFCQKYTVKGKMVASEPEPDTKKSA